MSRCKIFAAMLCPLFLLLADPRLAVADDAVTSARAEKDARIDRAVARWRRLGTKATPELVQTSHLIGDHRLTKAARSELVRAGLAAIEPLIHFKSDLFSPAALIAEILCQTDPLDTATLEKLSIRLAPVVVTKEERLGANLWFALTDIFSSPTETLVCPNRPALAASFSRRLLSPETVAKLPPRFRPEFSRMLPKLLDDARPPDHGEGYVPILAHFADQDATQVAQVHVQALGRFGAAAASAIPVLKARLLRDLDAMKHASERTEWLAPPREWIVAAIALAAAAIGPPARVLLDDLERAYLQEAERICRSEVASDTNALLRALAALEPARWKNIAEATERAWSALDHCGDSSKKSKRAAPVVPGEPGSRTLMDGIAAFGAQAASFAPKLLPLLANERLSFAERGQVARALDRLGASLPAREADLSRILVARLAREEKEATHRGPEPLKQVADGAKAALQALHDCEEDAGLGRPATAHLDDLLPFAFDEHRSFAVCVSKRLCGPATRVLGETLAVCCDYAYSGPTVPPYCLPQGAK